MKNEQERLRLANAWHLLTKASDQLFYDDDDELRSALANIAQAEWAIHEAKMSLAKKAFEKRAP
jgi:hypothetical protein